MFEIEFGDCDESVHPHCAGVVCATVLRVSGFVSEEEAETYARDVLYDQHTAAGVLDGPGDRLAAVLLVNGRDPSGIVLRDYNVIDVQTSADGGVSRLVVAGDHDDFGLFDEETSALVGGGR